MLISRLSALGDVVCTLPVASAIKSQWPDAEVAWIVDRRFRAVADACQSVGTVYERMSPSKVRELGRFDAALDMQGLLKSGILVGMAKADRKLGYHWQREGAALFSQAVIPDKSSIHIVDQYVDVARTLGAEIDHTDFALVPGQEAVQKVRAKLEARGWSGAKLAVFNAGAGWVTKRWHPSRFAALADKLFEQGTEVAFLGAPTDREVLAEVQAHGARQAIDLVGETSIAELIALISLAGVHVGGDTGSTHIAAALNVPAIGIYTLTRLERSCPYGQIERCFQGNPEVEPVFEKVMEALC